MGYYYGELHQCFVCLMVIVSFRLEASKNAEKCSRKTSEPEEFIPIRAVGSTEDFLRSSSKKAQMPASGYETVESSRRSDIQEELDTEVRSESEDQNSEHLLELDRAKSGDSNEKLSVSKHVSSSPSQEPHDSTSHSHQEREINSKPYTAEEYADTNFEIDYKIPLQPSSPSTERFAKEEKHVRCVGLSSHTQDYHDDFEASEQSSPMEKPQSSEASAVPHDTEALMKDSQSKATTYDSQHDEVEEEIAEELSYHSGTSGASQLSGRLLDLHSKTKESKVTVNSAPTPLASVKDEMSDFNIGDRVLVGGVQPGTLKFKGPTSFANGFWAGVELDKSEGSNNGTYDGVVYFACNERHGIFAPPDKIRHLPDRFEMYTDATEDDDSFFDDLPDKGTDNLEKDETKSHEGRHLKSSEQSFLKIYGSGDNNVTDELTHQPGFRINSQYNKESINLISNGNTDNIILNFENGPNNLLFSAMDKVDKGKGDLRETTTLDNKGGLDSQYRLTPVDIAEDRNEAEKQKDKDLLDTFADKLIRNFLNETVNQFAEIKKAKEQKIEAANQLNGGMTTVEDENLEGQECLPSVEQKDGLPFFIPAEQELSSPELCNRPVSAFLPIGSIESDQPNDQSQFPKNLANTDVHLVSIKNVFIEI